MINFLICGLSHLLNMKNKKTVTYKNIQPPSNSVVRINEKQYRHIGIPTKSQLLSSDYSHYNSYQKLLYNLCTSLKKKGLGYRKISITTQS